MLNTSVNHVDNGRDRSSPDNSGRRTRRKWLGSVNQHCVAEDGHAVARLCNKGRTLLFHEGVQAEGGPRQSNGRA